MSEKCGSCASVISTRRPAISCGGFCQRAYHLQCIDIPADILASLSQYPALSWRCEKCCKGIPAWDFENLNKILEEKYTTLLEDLKEKFDVLKNEISESASRVITRISADKASEIKKSYSAALKTEAAVIIKPKIQSQKNAETKADILNKANPVDNKINISKLKNIKDGGILVGCSSTEEASKFKEIVKKKLNQNYEVRDVKNLNPRIRIVGMSEKLDENELIEYIKFQNKHLGSENSECKVLKVWPTKRNANVFQAILQIDSVFYNNIMSAGDSKVIIGFDLCNAYDSIDIRRCFKCSGFNHISDQCKTALRCPRCGDEHSVKNCTSEHLKCINCVEYAITNKTSVDVNHASWDHNCFVYKLKVDEFKSKMSLSA